MNGNWKLGDMEMGRFGAEPWEWDDVAWEWEGGGHRDGNIWGKGNVGGRTGKSECYNYISNYLNLIKETHISVLQILLLRSWIIYSRDTTIVLRYH